METFERRGRPSGCSLSECDIRCCSSVSANRRELILRIWTCNARNRTLTGHPRLGPRRVSSDLPSSILARFTSHDTKQPALLRRLHLDPLHLPCLALDDHGEPPNAGASSTSRAAWLIAALIRRTSL